MLTVHGKCGKTWTQRGNRTSHCGGCCQTFSTLSLFDAHHRIRKGESFCWGLEGYEDQFRKFVRDQEGVWWTPQGLEYLDVLRERMNSYRADR